MVRQNDFHELEKLFWELSRKMGYLWREIYEETFPGSQSHVLFLLERSGPKKMSELANSLNLTPGAVTTASDRLIEHGYISRTRDEKDRRVVHLALTQKGRSTLDALKSEGRKIIKLVFNDISAEDLEKMNIIFKQANINTDKIRKGYDK